LISKKHINLEELSEKLIAIPGKYTTANLLLGIAWPAALNKKEYLFSDIESALLDEEVDAGVIIHETRFTYHKKGLLKIADLGEYWEELTTLPIPLGAIVINRSIPEEVALKVNRILKRSLEFTYKDSLASYDFVVDNAQEMDRDVMNKHIKLFVNSFTLNLGSEGRKAIEKLFTLAVERKIIPKIPQRIFLTSPES
jgi:1,4-dihydroxy-6-naphthoate synthase